MLWWQLAPRGGDEEGAAGRQAAQEVGPPAIRPTERDRQGVHIILSIQTASYTRDSTRLGAALTPTDSQPAFNITIQKYNTCISDAGSVHFMCVEWFELVVGFVSAVRPASRIHERGGYLLPCVDVYSEFMV